MNDRTAIIYYVDAEPGQQYWRINRQGIVKGKALDERIRKGKIEMGECVSCQWPSRNLIYKEQ